VYSWLTTELDDAVCHSSMGPAKRRLSDGEPGESSTSRLKPDMSLELVPNVLDDSTHSELDEQVIKTVGNDEDEPFAIHYMRDAVVLLLAILSNSEKRLDQSYASLLGAQTLIRENPSLMELLKKAWNDKQFKGIRNLSTFITRMACFRCECEL
jgi:hypothetical protein